jgi:hypothetical protein
MFAWIGAGFLFCSHRDVFAEIFGPAGHPLKFDAASMAKFRRTGTATHRRGKWPKGLRIN